MTWTRVFEYLYSNKVTIIFNATLFIGAMVKTAPMPGSKFDMYTWAYDFLHQFFNVTNTRLAVSLVPTPPLPPIVEANEAPLLHPKP